MDIQNIGKVLQTGLQDMEVAEVGKEKGPGKVSEFEKVRLEQLEQEQQVTGLKADEIQFNENALSMMDVKKVQNDFLKQVQARGEGKELEVLSDQISKCQSNVEDARKAVPAVQKSELGGAVENYFTETENRFKTMDSLYKDIASGDRQYSMQDLLKIQVQLQNINQNIEILSRVVDKVVDGMKTVLRTQV